MVVLFVVTHQIIFHVTGLASEKSSDGFIVDINNPKITKDIQRNTDQGSITNGTQVS